MTKSNLCDWCKGKGTVPVEGNPVQCPWCKVKGDIKRAK